MEKVDYHVLTVPPQAASVDGLVERGEDIDLAIMDVDKMAPKGEEILHSLHKSYPKVRLVFMSSEAEGSGSEVGPAGHVRGYLRRPVRKAQLLGTVLAVMDAPTTLTAR